MAKVCRPQAANCLWATGHTQSLLPPLSILRSPLCTILSVALSIMLQAICCNLPIKCFMFKRQKQQQNTHPQRALAATLCISFSPSFSFCLSLSVCPPVGAYKFLIAFVVGVVLKNGISFAFLVFAARALFASERQLNFTARCVA